MRSRARLGAGLVAAVMAAAVATGAATEAGASGQPATGQAQAATAAAVKAGSVPAGKPPKPDVDPVVKAAAKRFGLSERKIDQALMDVKLYVSKHRPATKDDVDLLAPAVVQVFAKSLGVSTSRARAVLKFLLAGWEKASGGGKDGKGGPPPAAFSAAAVKFLASELHISTARAKQVWADLMKIAGKQNRTSVKDPAFIALARSLGLTPQAFEQVLVKLKQTVAQEFPGGKPGKPGEPGPKPVKPGAPPAKQGAGTT